MMEFIAGFSVGLWVGSAVIILAIIYLRHKGYISSPYERTSRRDIERVVDARTDEIHNDIASIEDRILRLTNDVSLLDTKVHNLSSQNKSVAIVDNISARRDGE